MPGWQFLAMQLTRKSQYFGGWVAKSNEGRGRVEVPECSIAAAGLAGSSSPTLLSSTVFPMRL